MILNGHCSYLPGNEWILNDTYAHQTDGRQQEMYLYHVPSNEIVPLGAFHAPDTYDGALRCDLHPRFSPDGKKVVFDSSHGGAGRQMYLLELDSIVN
jgi:Tol biopolymer transport system component